MPDEVRRHRCYLDEAEREQGAAVGTDEHENFDLEPRPAHEFDPASRAAHTDVVERSFDYNSLLTVRRRSGDVGI
jgi:hypothetical protein